jgi:hypothetical protein
MITSFFCVRKTKEKENREEKIGKKKKNKKRERETRIYAFMKLELLKLLPGNVRDFITWVQPHPLYSSGMGTWKVLESYCCSFESPGHLRENYG